MVMSAVSGPDLARLFVRQRQQRVPLGAAETAAALEIEFRDGRLTVGTGHAPRAGRKGPEGQGSLF